MFSRPEQQWLNVFFHCRLIPAKKVGSLTKADNTPLGLHRQDSEISGCAKQRPYQLSSVKMPIDKVNLEEAKHLNIKHIYLLFLAPGFNDLSRQCETRGILHTFVDLSESSPYFRNERMNEQVKYVEILALHKFGGCTQIQDEIILGCMNNWLPTQKNK